MTRTTSRPLGKAPDPSSFAEATLQKSSSPEADGVLSRLIMGFVERRVSPQSIADVVLTQINDHMCEPDDISEATCTGMLEALSSTGSVSGIQEILIFISKKKNFPKFLSLSASMGSLSSLLLHPFFNTDPHSAGARELMRLTDQISKKIVEALAARPHCPDLKTKRMRLANALKSAHSLVAQLGPNCPNLIVLYQVLLKGVSPRAELVQQSTFSSVHSVIAAISRTPDHVLVHHSPKDYLTVEARTNESVKLEAMEEVLRSLGSPEVSRFQASFLVEWIFAGCLKHAASNGETAATLSHAIDIVLRQAPEKVDIMKGIVRALQRDLSLLHTEHSGVPGLSERIELAEATASQLFRTLWRSSACSWQWLNKEFVPWVLRLNCHPPESRLVTAEQIDRLRMLDSQRWSEGTGRPPSWVLRDASQTAALVFQMAPGVWLQLYGGAFADALHRESMASDFVLSSAHMDFVEFLVRTVRKKSPLFASEVETLVCLQIIGRARANEKNHMKLAVTRLRLQHVGAAESREQTRSLLELMTHPQSIEVLGPNPVARALALFVRCCRHVEVKTKREANRRIESSLSGL